MRHGRSACQLRDSKERHQYRISHVLYTSGVDVYWLCRTSRGYKREITYGHVGSVLGEVAPLVLQVYGSTAILEFVLGQSQGPLAPSQRHYRSLEMLHFFFCPRVASPGPASFLGLYLARGGGKRRRFGRLQGRPSDKHGDSVTTRGVECKL